MKHPHTSALLLRFVAIILGFLAATAIGAPTMGVAQQNLHDAADALNKARTSANPIVELQKAEHSLDEALHNKKGHRSAAVPIIERAIAEIKAGNRIAADKSINEALGEIDKAVAAGHKSLKHKK